MFKEQFFAVKSANLWPGNDVPQSDVIALPIDKGPTNSVYDATRLALQERESYVTLYSWTFERGIRVVALWRCGLIDMALAHIASPSLTNCPQALKIAIGRYVETAMRAAECDLQPDDVLTIA